MNKTRWLVTFLMLFSSMAYADADDDPSGANPINLGQEYTGNLSSSSDTDYYKFQLPNDGNVAVTLRHQDSGISTSTSTYWRGYLYVEGDLSNALHIVYLKGTPNTATIQEGLPAGTYYLKIIDYSYSPAQYHLKVDFEASDYYEKSPNHTPTTATTISLNHEYTGNLSSSSDTDYYKFQLPNDGNVAVTLRHQDSGISTSTSTYWRGYLYVEGDLSNALHIVYLKGTPNTATIQEGLPAGTYYLKIIDYSYSPAQYHLKVDFEASDYYEKSPNHTPTTATTISLNHEYTGNLSSSSDTDYYKFQLPNDGNVAVTLRHQDSGISTSTSTYWRGYLYVEGDLSNALHIVYLKGTPNTATIQEGLPAGTYYLKIIDYSYSPAQYHLKVDFEASDYYEKSPNHTPTTATTISLNHEYTGNLSSSSDTDYYKFQLPNDGNVAVTLRHQDSGISTSTSTYWRGYLYVEGDLSNALHVVYLKGTPNTATIQEELPAGTYYLKIIDYYYSPAQYHLKVEADDIEIKNDVIIDFGSPYGIWRYMNNSAWEQLHSLSPESMVTGDIDGSGQDDMIIDFGSSYGIYLWMNNNNWVQLHTLSPDTLVMGDIDNNGQDEVIIDFGEPYGIWIWMNNNNWVHLHSVSPDSMVTGDIDNNDQDEVIIDFGTQYGIWIWMNNNNWEKLHNLSPESMVTGDIDGNDKNDVFIDFGTQYGIWIWMNNNNWEPYSVSPDTLVMGDIDNNGQDEVIIDFGTQYGIWIWMNNNNWEPLHSVSPDSMVTGDIDNNGQDDIIIDFGTQYGIWQRMNNSTWVQLHTLSPKNMVTGNIDGMSEALAELDNTMLLPEANAEPLPKDEITELPLVSPQQ